MSGLTLLHECAVIERDTGFAIGIYRLRRLYIKLGITYTKPQRVFLLSRERKIELQKEREVFAVKLGKLIATGADIVYIDETTFNNTLREGRTWQISKTPVELEVNNKRLKGVTLYGAIGYCLNETVYMTGRSTNKEEFGSFLLKVVD
jgi:hypothetical protein